MDQAENVGPSTLLGTGTLTRWVVDVPLSGNEKYPGTLDAPPQGLPSQSSSLPAFQPARGDRPEPCAPCVPHECHPCGPQDDDSILSSPSLQSAACSPQSAAGPRARAQRRRRPRIIDPLAQARHFQQLIDSGQVKNAAQIARNLNLTRARISQILSLLPPSPRLRRTGRLAPEILDYIDNLNGDEGQMFLTAKKLLPLVRLSSEDQMVTMRMMSGSDNSPLCLKPQ